MRIEVPKTGRYVFTGESSLRVLQNDSMSTIDLLVRESIQNSLDAYDREIDYKYVRMNFIINKFDISKLGNHLEKVGDVLQKRIHTLSNEFICIEDTKTSGLDGKIGVETDGKETGNFEKLVYQLGDAQTKDGSGGSWGYGKTIYYRLGIGLVIFYSRYKDEDGIYKSRLAATLLERQSNQNGILNSITPDNRGIAWFGKKYKNDSNETVPLTDEEEIQEILDIFGIKPFKANEKGTKVIIPCINTTELLNDINRKKEFDDENYYWKKNFVDTLKNQILLWYAPRINNPYYKVCIERPYLKVLINSKLLEIGDEYPIYSIQRELYNKSLEKLYPNKPRNLYRHEDNDDVYMFNEKDICIEEIKRGSYTLGAVAFSKFSKLQLLKNNNFATPFVYLGKDNKDKSKNMPIISFTRSPGMIVDYQMTSPWADIPSTDENEFIIGLFVVNSNECVFDDDYKLEEYIRSCEQADHTSWKDKPYNNTSYRIVSKCQSGVKNAIINKYKPEEETVKDKPVKGMSQRLGNLFLPQGYNKAGRVVVGGIDDIGGGGPGGIGRTTSPRKYKFNVNRTYDFNPDSLTVDFTLELGKTVKKGIIEAVINVKGSKVSDGFPGGFPVSIEDVKLNKVFVDNVETYINFATYEVVDERMIYISKNNVNGVLKVKGSAILKTKDHRYVAQLICKKGE